MTNKRLGLLLAPLIPLTAIGVVEVASAIVAPQPVAIVETKPVLTTTHPMPAPPTPAPTPVAPDPPKPK